MANDNLDEFRAGSVRSRITALFALGIVFAAALAGAIAYRHDMLGNASTIYFITDSASGLAEGTAVTISEIGRAHV